MCKEITKDFRRDLEVTAVVQITLDMQAIASNSNCSHQLSSTEGDVRVETLPDRTYSLLLFLHSQTNVKHNFRKPGTYAVVL